MKMKINTKLRQKRLGTYFVVKMVYSNGDHNLQQIDPPCGQPVYLPLVLIRTEKEVNDSFEIVNGK